MGMLIRGKWTPKDQTVFGGEYIRNKSLFCGATKPKTLAELQTNAGRFWLIASMSCPWSHRTMIVRKLKQLNSVIRLHIAGGPRVEGYPMDGGREWMVPGTSKKMKHLHQLYSFHSEDYTGRATVPVLWDSKNQTIVSNESMDILQALDAISVGDNLNFTLRPDYLVAKIDAANKKIYNCLNNAVYRAGFAEKQDAYESAVRTVFETLDMLEKRLASSRYYFGNVLTETDIRIFPTLARFDVIYYILFKCSRRRLIDYPNVWGYARDLYRWQGVSTTVDFDAMTRASYLSDCGESVRMVAVLPDADWTSEHHREVLGSARVAMRTGEIRNVNPARLELLS